MQRWEEEAMWKREGREKGLTEDLTKGQIIAQFVLSAFSILPEQMTPDPDF